MIGTKRRNVSFSSNADDTPFQSKRLVVESPAADQAVASSQVEASPAPPLDRRRDVRQHVRALNTDFVSWVQSQIQCHPDELWEDGIRDYLAHASEILDKFTDVVNWMKANTRTQTGVPNIKNPSENSNEPQTFPSKFVFGSPNTNPGVATSLNPSNSGTQSSINGSPPTSWIFGTPSINNNTSSPIKTDSFSASKNETNSLGLGQTPPPFGQTSTFAAPWSSGVLSSTETVFKFGNNNSTASNDNATENAEEDDEPEQPSSPSLKSSEEKGIIVVHETKCKLYLKSTDPNDKEPWKDKGMGQLFIKCQEGANKGTKESKSRILVRNDVGRVMLNALLYSGIKTNLQKNAIVAIFHTSDGSGGESGNAKPIARTFLIKTKNEDERNKLADAIRDHAPAP